MIDSFLDFRILFTYHRLRKFENLTDDNSSKHTTVLTFVVYLNCRIFILSRRNDKILIHRNIAISILRRDRGLNLANRGVMSLDISPLISTLPSLLRDPSSFSVDRNSFVTEAGNTEREREKKKRARALLARLVFMG